MKNRAFFLPARFFFADTVVSLRHANTLCYLTALAVSQTH
jgi:hypothetical protein